MKALVLNISRFSFPNANGEIVEGSKITFCEVPSMDKNNKGSMPMTVNAPLDAYAVFESNVPAVYDIELSHKPDSKGKIQTKYNSAKFLESFVFPKILG
jgi:hypothetical protein